MSTAKLKEMWKKDYFQTAIMIVVIVMAVLVLWFGSQAFLGTSNPVLAVASGSMHLPKGTVDDGWSQPFARTLRIGDLIIVQGVRPEDIYAAPYNESGRSGDILVFRAIGSDELIVHRAVGKIVEPNGTIEFITQGDANIGPGPYSPTPAENVIGKVVMRIPWFGHLALFMREGSAIYLVLALIILLIIVEFAIPALRNRKTDSEPKNMEVKNYD
jgi:signal peptidase I